MTYDRLLTRLPPEVICQKESLASNGVRYVLRHSGLGDLGSVTVEIIGLHARVRMDLAQGGSQEIEQQCRLLLLPIAQQIAAAVGEPLVE